MVPEVIVPAPVARLACVIAAMTCCGDTPDEASFCGWSWICSCCCSTPERVTACAPSIACRRGTTLVWRRVASSSPGSDDETASWMTGTLLKFRVATFGGWAVGGSVALTDEIACWISASLAAMSVPNSYCTMMMLVPSLEKESYSLIPLVVLIACSIGTVTLRSTSLGEAPMSSGEDGQVGELHVGDQFLLE